MLHPSSESPAQPQRQQQGLRLPEDGRGERRQGSGGASIWKWISLREVVFVFAACSVGAALFQTRDNVR